MLIEPPDRAVFKTARTSPLWRAALPANQAAFKLAG